MGVRYNSIENQNIQFMIPNTKEKVTESSKSLNYQILDYHIKTNQYRKWRELNLCSVSARKSIITDYHRQSITNKDNYDFKITVTVKAQVS